MPALGSSESGRNAPDTQRSDLGLGFGMTFSSTAQQQRPCIPACHCSKVCERECRIYAMCDLAPMIAIPAKSQTISHASEASNRSAEYAKGNFGPNERSFCQISNLFSHAYEASRRRTAG